MKVSAKMSTWTGTGTRPDDPTIRRPHQDANDEFEHLDHLSLSLLHLVSQVVVKATGDG
jgi:hypothetical protein